MSTQGSFDHTWYLSTFSWRYGSLPMRELWSEVGKRRLWRRIWVALAESQAELGLLHPEQVEDLRAHAEDIDLERAHEIEAEIHHDLMSEVRTFAEQCPIGGGVIHLGATSMDIEDNADALRLRGGLHLVCDALQAVLLNLCAQIERWADTPTMGFTHLQPAEPTTIGYRLAQHAQDLATDLTDLLRLHSEVRGKGFKGAVGTSAGYAELLRGTGRSPENMERAVMARLGLEAFPVSTQTYPRKQDFRILSGLASLAQSLSKLGSDVRLLQSPPIGEWSEPFGEAQVGSSAMPFKRNPIHSENMCSLARFVAALPRVAWDNAAHNYLERTLDDSANRRTILPEAFLATDEMLRRAYKVVTGLQVDVQAADHLLDTYGIFAATERLMMRLARRGGDRQALHEVIRIHSLKAWDQVRRGHPNPLRESLMEDPHLRLLATAEEIHQALEARAHIGDAPYRARSLALGLRQEIEGRQASAREGQ